MLITIERRAARCLLDRVNTLLTVHSDSNLAMLSQQRLQDECRNILRSGCVHVARTRQKSTNYYDVAGTAIKDKSMLGTHGEELCDNLAVQWMTLFCDAAKKRRSKCVGL